MDGALTAQLTFESHRVLVTVAIDRVWDRQGSINPGCGNRDPDERRAACGPPPWFERRG